MKFFADILKKAKPIQGTDVVLKAYNIDGDVRIQYKDQSDFERIARQFGIFEEWKVIPHCYCVPFLLFTLILGVKCLI
jgi:alpha-1,3-mannosyl-glycoprotein beta-1,2-N-acetylglucosaminyltransferase